jgi:hypothetical protein
VYNFEEPIDGRFHLWSIYEIMEIFSVAIISNALSTLMRILGAASLEDISKGTFNRAEVSQHFREEFVEAVKENCLLY